MNPVFLLLHHERSWRTSRGVFLRIVFFGTPEFAVPSLQGLVSTGYDVAAVVTQPDRQAGRGRKIQPCMVKREAEEHGITVLQPERIKHETFIRQLESLSPSAVVVVAYGQILPPEILNLPRYGCINVHASLLPAYRGAAPVNWAIVNGENRTGITIMLMDKGMDTGPVLLQEQMDIKPDDTAGVLSRRLSEAGARLLIPALEGVAGGTLIPRPQTGKVSYAPPLKKTDALIQWSMNAQRLSQFIRGMNPWPGAYSFLGGMRVKIVKAVPVEQETGRRQDAVAGVIDDVTGDALIVNAGAGRLAIRELQPPGKPVMTVRSFLQGRTLAKDMRFCDS